MKRTDLFPIVFSFCFVIFSCSIAVAQSTDPCGQPWNTPLAEVTGEIVDVYYATPPWTNEEGLHLATKTSSGASVVIHVFPKNCIDNNPPEKFQFTIGELITTTGSEFLTEGGTQRNICAAEIAQRPDLALRSLQTGCLNEELCLNCQGFCEETCSRRIKPEVCMNSCLESCEANINPCPGGHTGVMVPTNFLLLNNL
jgi:hypothetical protein